MITSRSSFSLSTPTSPHKRSGSRLGASSAWTTARNSGRVARRGSSRRWRHGQVWRQGISLPSDPNSPPACRRRGPSRTGRGYAAGGNEVSRWFCSLYRISPAISTAERQSAVKRTAIGRQAAKLCTPTRRLPIRVAAGDRENLCCRGAVALGRSRAIIGLAWKAPRAPDTIDARWVVCGRTWHV